MRYLMVPFFLAFAVAVLYYYFASTGHQAQTIPPEKKDIPILPRSTPLPPFPDAGDMGQHPLDNLKEQVRSGIVTLFAWPEEREEERTSPLRHADIDPQLLRHAKEHIESIHNFRSVHTRLQHLMNDPAVNVVSSLSSAVVADPVLSTKILKMVNSAYYGRQEKVNSIGHALVLLGLVRLREILYREGMLELLKAKHPEKDSLIEVFWRHATLVSIFASNLRSLFPCLDRGILFTSGIIHDVGKIILVRMVHNPEYTIHSTIWDEDRIFGINHVIIGRLALEQWGFSEIMRSTIEHHHHPAFMPGDFLPRDQQSGPYLMVLFLADQLAKMVHPDRNYLPVAPLHPSYYSLIDQETFSRVALDNVLLSQVSKSEAFIT